MSLYTGVTGSISTTIATVTKEIAHMENWSVDIKRDMIDAVSFGNSYKEKVPSIKDWSASFDGSADFATDSGQGALITAFEDGTAITGKFCLTDTIFLTGTCYIESLSVKTAADGKADISIKVAGSGAVVLTVPAT